MGGGGDRMWYQTLISAVDDCIANHWYEENIVISITVGCYLFLFFFWLRIHTGDTVVLILMMLLDAGLCVRHSYMRPRSGAAALLKWTVIVTPSCLPEKKTSRNAFWDILGHNKSIWWNLQIWKMMVVFVSRIWRSLQIRTALMWCKRPTDAALEEVC